MKRKNVEKVIAVALASLMTVGCMAGCGSTEASTSADDAQTTDSETAKASDSTSESSAAEDVITVMVPPVAADYQDKMDEWAEEFHEKYPNLTIEVTDTSWDDHNEKVSTMAQAGESPDIVELSYSNIGQYVEMGVAVNINDYMDKDTLADYDQNALDYMTLDGATYGLPLYITIQALGANKDMLTAAGVDVESIQQNGWSFDEFMNAIKNGTDASNECYGFVFATSNVTAADFLTVFGTSAGLTNAFTDDLKYAYTSTNMLNLLEKVEDMVASGYMPNYGVDAAQRMVMCETGNAMIFGKAMPLFENNITANNAALEADDGTAVENSVNVNYSFIPVPTMDGVSESCFGTVDGLVAMRNSNTTDEHLANVMLALDFLCSGERAAYVDDECCLDSVCQTGRDALKEIESSDRDAGNVECASRLIGLVSAPPTGITADMSTDASQLMEETIAPKFQSLLAGECTAQEMYDAVCKAAYGVFGEDKCETGTIK